LLRTAPLIKKIQAELSAAEGEFCSY